MQQPIRIINSVAPIRICDNGGWTDTWFAEYGKIFNIAVYPYVEVQVKVFTQSENDDSLDKRIIIDAENYGDRYAIDVPDGRYDKHPLIEAAFDYMQIPKNMRIEVSIFSEAPAGCSTGTSAAVSVALVGALDCLTPGRLAPHQVAQAAQKIETELLHQQCGIQDQIASAFGGINFIDMHHYPNATVSPIQTSNAIWWELESRLALIFVGNSHNSSDVHRSVIQHLENRGPEADELKPLRLTAEMSRDALYAGDFDGLGRAMIRNTEAQEHLHPELIGSLHRRVIDVAKDYGAIGWKVNGAGGSGGSVTILTDSNRTKKRKMLQAIEVEVPGAVSIPIYLSRFGLRVWESAANPTTQPRNG